MREKIIFRVDYDHRADEIVSIISEKLKQFGLSIEWVEGERDGFELFEIVGTPKGYCQKCGKELDERDICKNPYCDNYIKIPNKDGWTCDGCGNNVFNCKCQ